MNKTKRAHLPTIPPIPAILAAIVSVQGGAALAKGLFPALGATGTVGLRVGISAVILLAAFRPRLRRVTAAQWWALIPYGVVGGRVSRMLPGGAAVATGGFAQLTPGLFAAGIGVALLSSAIPYTLEMIALKELPARTFGILMSLEPAVAALAGLVFLREVLTPRQWLAVALVIAASTGSTLTARPAEQVAEGESGGGVA